MAERTIEIGGKSVRLKASALLPKQYKYKFGRDLIVDMYRLAVEEKRIKASAEQAKKDGLAAEEQERLAVEAQFSYIDLVLFENVTWLMAKAADPSIPDDPDEWLDSLDGIFSIYEHLGDVFELWRVNTATMSVPAKK